ncbi:MAG TPA: hypothetical protein VFG86_08125 [Chloroflexota bacterium]|nr:hypothetical protein [Chloroflexota bacterium]
MLTPMAKPGPSKKVQSWSAPTLDRASRVEHFVIDELERSKLGIVERVAARKL